MSPTSRTAGADDLGMGDGALAAPAGAAVPEDTTPVEAPDDGDEVEVTRNRPRAFSGFDQLALFRGAVVILLLAVALLSYFTLNSTNQLRDQYTLANGLQKCLINAQLNQNSTTDPNGTAYKAAVTACVNK